ncbi:hypothetical protein YC2023_024942 [Brassica napus]
MGKRNIITPAPNRPAESKIPERQHREYPSIYYYGSSPPYSTRRGHRRSQQDELRRDSPSALSPRQQGNVQWRVKQPMTDMTGAAPQNSLESARPAVDPTESTAHKQRVLVSDAQGDMEVAPQRIINAAIETQTIQAQLRAQHMVLPPAVIPAPSESVSNVQDPRQSTTVITGKK